MYIIAPRITPREIEVSRVLGTTAVVREIGSCVLRWSLYFGDFASGGNCRSKWMPMPGGFLLCLQATRLDEGSYICAARAWEPGMGELTDPRVPLLGRPRWPADHRAARGRPLRARLVLQRQVQ